MLFLLRSFISSFLMYSCRGGLTFWKTIDGYDYLSAEMCLIFCTAVYVKHSSWIGREYSPMTSQRLNYITSFFIQSNQKRLNLSSGKLFLNVQLYNLELTGDVNEPSHKLLGQEGCNNNMRSLPSLSALCPGYGQLSSASSGPRSSWRWLKTWRSFFLLFLALPPI